MRRISELTKSEKISLLRKIAAGKVQIIDGQLIEGEGIVLIEKKGKRYFDTKCTLPVLNLEKLARITLIILPYNERE